MSASFGNGVLLLFVLLSLVFFSSPSFAYPGQQISEAVSATCAFFKEYCSQPHLLLDNLYVEYFSAKEKNDQKLAKLKIGIYSHLYMLKQKLEKNKNKLKTVRMEFEEENGVQMPKPLHLMVTLKRANSAYVQLRNQVDNWAEIAICNSAGPNIILTAAFYRLALCLLLKAKIVLLNTLDEGFLLRGANEVPKCYGPMGSKVIADADNAEHISEVIASDLMHFLPLRAKFKKFLIEINQKSDERQMEDIRQKFIALVGISRFAMISDANVETIGPIMGYDQPKPFALLYKVFFESNSKLGKWRSKIVIQKRLYDENANKLISDQMGKAISASGKGNDKLTFFQRKIDFFVKMKEIWLLYSDNFWLDEKKMREKVEQMTKKNKAKNLGMINDALTAHWHELNEMNLHRNEKYLFAFWEEGPEDCALLRALTLCMRETIDEYVDKWDGQSSATTAAEEEEGNDDGKRDELSVIEQWKMANCVGRHLRRSGERNSKRDEQVAKMHVAKMEQLLMMDDGNGEHSGDQSFGEILSQHKKLWGELVDAQGVEKLMKLFSEAQFFSANEQISSPEAEVSGEEFVDANGEQNDNNNNNNNENNNEVRQQHIPDQIPIEWAENDGGHFGTNENAKNKPIKNKTNSTNSSRKRGQKKEQQQNVPRAKNADKNEEGAEGKSKGTPTKSNSATSKYYHKIAKNKERKKKN